MPLILVPFPGLPSRIAPPSNTKKTTKKRLRHHDHDIRTNSCAKIKEGNMAMPLATAENEKATTSAPISLPGSHIRRTPSELRLVEAVRRAECDDARMYSRLLDGMQSKMHDRGEDGAHPFSWKSMKDIAATKLVTEQGLQQVRQEPADPNDAHNADDGGWEVSYTVVAKERESRSSAEDPTPSSKDLKDSLSKRMADAEKSSQEDDFVFSMEL